MSEVEKAPSSVDTNVPASASCGGRPRWIILWLIVLTLSYGGLAYSVFFAQSAVDTARSGDSEAIGKLTAKVQELESRLAETKREEGPDTAGGRGAPASAPAVAELQDTPSFKALSAQLEEMKLALAQTTAANSLDMAQVVARLLAFIRLQSKAMTGEPFEAEMEALATAMGNLSAQNRQALEALKPFASSGIPDLSTVREGWLAVSGSLQSALSEEAAQTWVDRVKAVLQSLVSIRKLHPDGTGQPVDAIPQALAAGHVDEALQRFQMLSEKARKTAEAWARSAQTHVGGQKALDALAQTLMAPAANRAEESSLPPSVDGAAP